MFQQISELCRFFVLRNQGSVSVSFNSAGFYDLSDGGSCSLSNSCTSVFSESISSSHASLLPNCQHPTTRLSIFDYRPKSADETTVHSQFQQQGVYTSDGCRIKACPDISGTPTRSRPRPVSTGNYSCIILLGWTRLQCDRPIYKVHPSMWTGSIQDEKFFWSIETVAGNVFPARSSMPLACNVALEKRPYRIASFMFTI